MRLIIWIWWTRVLFLDLITLDTFEMNHNTSSSIYSFNSIIMYCNIYHQSMFIYRTTSTWDMTWGIWNGITSNQLLIDKCDDSYDHSLAYMILNDLLWHQINLLYKVSNPILITSTINSWSDHDLNLLFNNKPILSNKILLHHTFMYHTSTHTIKQASNLQ